MFLYSVSRFLKTRTFSTNILRCNKHMIVVIVFNLYAQLFIYLLLGGIVSGDFFTLLLFRERILHN